MHQIYKNLKTDQPKTSNTFNSDTPINTIAFNNDFTPSAPLLPLDHIDSL